MGKKTKAIIFDFGNVICTFDNNIFLKEIAKFSDKSVSEMDNIIYDSSDIKEKYEKGIISSDTFFQSVVEACNLSISKDKFIEAYTDIFTPIPETFDLISLLQSSFLVG